jgi:hypothetical protein
MVTFFDQEQEQIQQLSTSTALEILQTGQTSPFIVTLKNADDSLLIDSYEAKIGNLASTASKENKLSVIFHKLETTEGNIVVSGRIVNDGSSVSANTKAMVILYNVIGEPIRFMSVFTEPRDILPFGSAIFSARIRADNTIEISGYAISSESSNYAETMRLVQVQPTSMQRIREVANVSNLFTLDSNNQVIAVASVGNPVLVKMDITNMLSESREYTYFLQVIDQNGFVSSLSWSMGTLAPRQSTTVVIAWVPDEPGSYILQAFLWKNVEEPIPLAFRFLATSIQVR